MKCPPFITPGSVIRIVSPAGKMEEIHLSPLEEWLKAGGYSVERGKYVSGSHFQYAGTDSERLSDLQEALDDPAVDVIWCSRGGYGTIRIIDQLDFTAFSKYPKWVIGYSDITVLHNRLHELGFCSIHGTMYRHALDESGHPAEGLATLMNLLQGEHPEYRWPSLPVNRPGKISAPLTGGNLSLLYSLLGTPYDVDTRGKILFIEEIGEYLYHLDRMMVSLRLAGKFDQLAGLVAGQFSDMKDNEEPFGKSTEEIILDAVKGFDFPVAFGFSAGHQQPNLALMMGGTYSLEVQPEETTLKLLQSSPSPLA